TRTPPRRAAAGRRSPPPDLSGTRVRPERSEGNPEKRQWRDAGRPAVSARSSPQARSSPRHVPDVLAAVDLGSNSFHMIVARYSHGQLIVIDRLREMVRLAAGVEENGRIDKEVAARAIACLQRFGQRLRDMHADSVRVVGTNALRLAHRKQAFLERA